jgi:GNAT superfamily N-acetyltransferase
VGVHAASATEEARSGFARALAFQRETLALIADEVTDVAEGCVVRSAALPLVWSLNHLRVMHPIGFDEAVAAAERHLQDLPYRHLMVEEDAGAEQLAAQFRSACWEVDVELTMLMAGDRDREVDLSNVVDASEEETLELYGRWIAEDYEEPPEAQRQVVEHTRLIWRARNARRFGVPAQSGALASMTVLMSGGPVAQVEDVYTAPEERGRGYARALVTRALDLARAGGYELTFITADDGGWPKQLYARLGFVPAGRVWLFTRRPRLGS